MYATRYRSGRVFCMGDAVHRHPAVERAGLQHLDPGRLQPGLEARARAQGQGGAGAAGLLRRRAGADRQADRAARQQEHRGIRRRSSQALGFDDTSDPETMQARIADREDNTPEAARKREAAA